MPCRWTRYPQRAQVSEVSTYDGPRKRIVGVLGGMGPLATADFLSKVIQRTEVATEADHLPLAIWSNPEIPDRTRALLGVGPSPVPAMTDGVTRLLEMGASAIAIPCNTAHAFVPELEATTRATFLNMIDVAVDHVVQNHPGTRRVGVLGTRGTRLAGLYAKACAARDLDVIDVPDDLQHLYVDVAIRQVKTGGDRRCATALVGQAAATLAMQGADVAIAACTEIPLVAQAAAKVLPVVDATDCLAAALVAYCSQGHIAVQA